MSINPVTGSNRQRKANYELHPSHNARFEIYNPLPGELDTDYAQRISSQPFTSQQHAYDTWNSIQRNTWQQGHHHSSYHTGYLPKDKPVVQLKFSTPRDNGAGGTETFMLEPRQSSGGYAVDVYTIPEGRNKPSYSKGLVRFDENGKLPAEQYRYLTGGGFGEPDNKTASERKQYNRVLGDANRAMKDFLHNKKAGELHNAKYQK